MATAPLPSWGPKARQKGYITPAFPRVLSAQQREMLNNGYFTLAFLGTQIWAPCIHGPCLIGDPRCSTGRNSEFEASPLPTRGGQL